MNEIEAEKIINEYGGAIARGPIKRLSWLPCSKAKIKQAYFVYLPAIMKNNGNLPKEIGEQLVLCYAMMNMFIDDGQADRLEDIKKRIDAKSLNQEDPEDKKLYHEYFAYIQGMMNGELYDEINEYIGECQNEVN